MSDVARRAKRSHGVRSLPWTQAIAGALVNGRSASGRAAGTAKTNPPSGGGILRKSPRLALNCKNTVRRRRKPARGTAPRETAYVGFAPPKCLFGKSTGSVHGRRLGCGLLTGCGPAAVRSAKGRWHNAHVSVISLNANAQSFIGRSWPSWYMRRVRRADFARGRMDGLAASPPQADV